MEEFVLFSLQEGDIENKAHFTPLLTELNVQTIALVQENKFGSLHNHLFSVRERVCVLIGVLLEKKEIDSIEGNFICFLINEYVQQEQAKCRLRTMKVLLSESPVPAEM